MYICGIEYLRRILNKKNKMSKSFKFNNNVYLDSKSIVHGRQLLADIIYPVGSIYISTININPSTYYGGEWEPFATGKTLVGIDTNDSDFNEIEKTGGQNELQEHTHELSGNGAHSHTTQGRTSSGSTTPAIFESFAGAGGTRNVSVPRSGSNGGHTHTINSTGGGTSYTDSPDNGNLQPYIVVYMWKRTT